MIVIYSLVNYKGLKTSIKQYSKRSKRKQKEVIKKKFSIFASKYFLMYTVKEASKELNITTRAVTMRCKKEGLKKKGKSYIIPKTLLNQWKNPIEEEAKRRFKKKTQKEDDNSAEENNTETITEEFNEEEYELLQKIIHEYPMLQKRLEEQTGEIKYLRGEITHLIDSNKGLIKTLQQSNLLQAKDKGYDKD
jgi:molybdopterin converting factor small subunit